MQFNSMPFFIFLLVVLIVNYVFKQRLAARNLALLIFSYFFYACWDWRFLSLIWLSTLVDYTCAIYIAKSQTNTKDKINKRKAGLLISICTNLGVLCIFKYFGFFVSSFADLFQTFGIELNIKTLNVILPVGISFYTFQTMGYTIDVFRKNIKPEKRLINFALYVAFFPQLVAGPIERASRLLPQFESYTIFSAERINQSFFLIFSGLFKKVVLADNLCKIVDPVYSSINSSGLEIILATYAFAIQIYCDFSGYSDIAIGCAGLLGFDLMQNFNLPYFSTNPREFWQRWHISLSSWLRDYLYIPLGGSKRGKVRNFLNVMITMGLGGLWHGAAWNFVFWGLFHGLIIWINRITGHIFSPLVKLRFKHFRTIFHYVKIIAFFQVIVFSWMLFRVENFKTLSAFLKTLFSFNNFTPMSLHQVENYFFIFIPCAAIIAIVQFAQYVTKNHLILYKSNPVFKGFIYSLGIFIFIFFGEYGGETFIYFQF